MEMRELQKIVKIKKEEDDSFRDHYFNKLHDIKMELKS